MRLKKLVMINCAPFERLELDFGDENITLLSGINGSGKTTILSYIVDAFYELAKKGFENEFENKKTKYYRISSSLFSKDRTIPSIVYLRFLLEDGRFADYIDIRDACTQEQYDTLLDIPDKITYSNIEQQLKKQGVNKYWAISDKQEITNMFSNYIFTYFPAYRYETPYFLNDPYKFQLEFTKDMGFTGYLSNPIEVTSDLPDIANWIMDVVLDQDIYKGSAQRAWTQLNEIITNILFNKTHIKTRVGIGQRFAGATRISIMDRANNGGQVYPSIFTMSSGELALLCLFVEILKQTDKIGKEISNISGIILIDEIDKHLHIKLQKEVLPTLIAMFPNIQFIASSHSPFLGLGLADANIVTYRILDLDNGGVSCPPQDNELFKEVYNMMISENDRYASKYRALEDGIKSSKRPLIITEGKTDWKHLKAAMKALSISDLDVEFYEYEDTLGDKTLLQLLKDYARIKQPRTIIGIFDRDNFSGLNYSELETLEFITFQNNVFAFAIPLVNADEYGNSISIEHYYKKPALTKVDTNGRRLFLGWEFYDNGLSKDRHFLTRCSNISNKSKINGIIDEKVYDITIDPKGEHSVALTKNDFATLILNQDSFADGFDFSEFTKIFEIIRKIIAIESND